MPRHGADVYQALKEAISNGSLRANEPLREERVAEALGVSRTPVREALIRLLAEGLIEADGSGGARVADVTAEDLDEVFTLREVLEPLAVRYAARRPKAASVAELRQIHDASREALVDDDIERLLDLNTQFHATLNAMAAPRRLKSFIDQLRVQSRRFRVLALYDQEERRQSVAEHGRLLDLVEHQNADGAVALLLTHFERPRARMASYLGPTRTEGLTPLGSPPSDQRTG
jgi:DNA-binding GntR family transcriptional regulator